ncbi:MULTISPECIES: hypothetical protein [Aerosakkonema]|uniref:hypothetical protein n=1 Tax=Aerosakkonema TaxID=1246629 RepID=UPI0035BA78AC
MDRHKQNQRREAAKAFMASLNEFENFLAPDAGEALASTPEVSEAASPSRRQASPTPIELDAFEQAAADIEDFIQRGKK